MSFIPGISIKAIEYENKLFGYSFEYPGKKLYMMLKSPIPLFNISNKPFPPYIRNDILPGEYYESTQTSDVFDHVFYVKYIDNNVIRDGAYQQVKYDTKNNKVVETLKSGTYTNGLLTLSEEVSKIVTAPEWRVEQFFGPQKNIDLSKLQFTNISLYSVTPYKEAQVITRYILKNIKKQKVSITDATANIGGNTISFASSFNSVNAVEIDPLTCQVLTNNINVFGLKNVKVYCADYLSIMNKLSQDVIFFDPPWGGVGYKESKSLDLYLGVTPKPDILSGNTSLSGPRNIIDICQEIITKRLCKIITLKIPTNYNMTGLSEMLKKNKKKMNTKNIIRKGRISYIVVLIFV
jgi:hypothetical protein